MEAEHEVSVFQSHPFSSVSGQRGSAGSQVGRAGVVEWVEKTLGGACLLPPPLSHSGLGLQKISAASGLGLCHLWREGSSSATSWRAAEVDVTQAKQPRPRVLGAVRKHPVRVPGEHVFLREQS